MHAVADVNIMCLCVKLYQLQAFSYVSSLYDPPEQQEVTALTLILSGKWSQRHRQANILGLSLVTYRKGSREINSLKNNLAAQPQILNQDKLGKERK